MEMESIQFNVDILTILAPGASILLMATTNGTANIKKYNQI